MSTRKNSGSSDQHHQRVVELHDSAAHAHLVGAEAHEKQDHQTGHERSRQALEHAQKAHQHMEHSPQDPIRESGTLSFGDEDVAVHAHELWEARGCPDGSPDEDWFRATQQLQARKEAAK